MYDINYDVSHVSLCLFLNEDINDDVIIAIMYL